jgi:oxygen-independent coproporphyrinogen-3 oxidase
MSGIYIHIPFCKQACHYCDFHFSTSLKNKEHMLQALHAELDARSHYLVDRNISTIYFGGGTPSLLTSGEVNKLVDHISEVFTVAWDAEITLEANPDDLTDAFLKALKTTPVNRFSVGIQSFRDEDLKRLNRAHNAREADRCVKSAQDHGFENITIDLMYALPHLTNEAWQQNLNAAFALQVPHISAYCLTIEPKTFFGHQFKKGAMDEVPDDVAAAHYHMMLEEMDKHGFVHYEVSNFCKPGRESKHNSAYWDGVSYLGLGPSAHSFNGSSRQWNVASNASYMKALLDGGTYFEREELTRSMQINELLLTGLRTKKGVDTQKLEKLEWNIRSLFGDRMEEWKEEGKMIDEGSFVKLTEEGLLFADYIASEMFHTESEKR